MDGLQNDTAGRLRARRTLKWALALALVVGAVSGAALAATAGPHFTAWSLALKIDTIPGNSSELNTMSLDKAYSVPKVSSVCLAAFRSGSTRLSAGLLDGTRKSSGPTRVCDRL